MITSMNGNVYHVIQIRNEVGRIIHVRVFNSTVNLSFHCNIVCRTSVTALK